MAGIVFFLLATVLPLWLAKMVMWSWGIELISLVCVVVVAARGGLRKTFKNGREV